MLELDNIGFISTNMAEIMVKSVTEMSYRPVLFEKADGVYVNLQGKDRIESHQKKAEIKVAIAYDGWKQQGNGRC